MDKDLSLFKTRKVRKSGKENICKECAYRKKREYYKTKKGLFTNIYTLQTMRSKKRGHEKQSYTKKWLIDWALSQNIFHEIYDKWKNSGYETNLRPSIDRIDNSIGYTKENIQIMTVNENVRKH